MRKTAISSSVFPKFAAGLAALVVVLGVGQVVQSSGISEKSHQIRVLEREVADLKDLGEQLELKMAEDQTVAAVESRAGALGLVPSDKVEYVTPTAPVVAKR